MRKIIRNIFLIITGLLIINTLVIPALQINNGEDNIIIKKVQNELRTEILKCKSFNDRLRSIPQITAIGEFEWSGDQLHPAFDLGDNGGYMAAFYNSDYENIMWTYKNDDAVYYDVEGGDYPSIKLWNETRFFGTFVPSSYDSSGGVVYLFETTDPTDWDNQYNLVGWDWSDNGWSDFLDLELACDNSKEEWEWGFISMVGSTNVNEVLINGPFISYPTSEDGYATMSWYYITGCAHTDNTIDKVSKNTYSIYDVKNKEDTNEKWGFFIRIDNFADWDKESEGYIYSDKFNLQYPAISSYNDNIVAVMESDEEGNKNIICMYGSYIEDLDSSVVVDSDIDERYPDVVHINGETFLVTYEKNGNIYAVISENAGKSWGEPFQINENDDAVIAEYKYSDLSTNGLQAMWQEESYDIDIWYGSPSGNEPPQAPSIEGPSKGKRNINYNFTFTAEDPENDQLYYYIDWGDGTNSGWVGPYNSGMPLILSHTWTDKKAYTITVKARDFCGNRGLESTFPFSTSKSKSKALIFFNIYIKLIQQFPFILKILNQIIL